MTEFDGRKISHEALEELRMRAVKMVLSGESPETVIKSLGMSRGCIYKWLAAYNESGFDALRAKKLFGRPPSLTPVQMRWLFRVVKKDPRQLFFSFALWTAKMLGEALYNRFGTRVSKATMCRVLRRMGLSPQKPLHRAIQQNPKAVEKWLTEEFPAIQAEAKQVGAAIYFGDEAGVSSSHHSGTTWGQEGKTPIVRTTGKHFRVSMVSAVSARGDMRFMIVDGTIRSAEFCTFLHRLTVKANSPIFLVLDNLGVHKTVRVKELVASTNGMLKLFFLPPYSPDLNPDELVWNELKGKMGRTGSDEKEELKGKVHGFMRDIQRDTKKVARYFQESHVKYAA
jgi:transposase